MATQINSILERRGGEGAITILNATLITSGTTITYTFPAQLAALVHGYIYLNRTTGVPTAGGTYTPSTGVYVSPTMAVNDVGETIFFMD